MHRFLLLIGLCATMGCQTTQTGGTSRRMGAERFSRIEQLSVYVESYLDTYDVVVQRAAMEKDAAGNGEWVVLGSPRVSGYSGRWLAQASGQGGEGYVSKSSYFLDGDVVEVDVHPGVQLAVKIVPQKAGSIRVVGVYSQAQVGGNGWEEVNIPFDTTCSTGARIVVYRKEFSYGIPAGSAN